jgi:cytochrome o ubiquinol oxidase subunit 2
MKISSRGFTLVELMIVIAIIGILAAALLAGIYLRGKNIGILDPKGTIALQQRNLMLIGVLLSLVVVVPVFIMTFYIYARYKDDGRTKEYRPDWDHSASIEAAWWLIPVVLISILSVITWKSSHDLDPYKPVSASTKPLTIKVIALQWKWLFIYPEENIATVNYVEIPEDTPVDFVLTSDAPMNSFWIPQLGGQVYAMSGMSTHLNLMANTIGDYNGVSSNISGKGFAGMTFKTYVRSQDDYLKWVNASRDQDMTALDMQGYNELALPSENNKMATYSPVDQSLYDKVVNKYMTSHHEHPQQEGSDESTHHLDEGGL